MGDSVTGQLLLQLFLIMVNAVFACAEIAIISINDTKLERLSATGDKRAKKLLTLTKIPSKFLATIQVGITLAGFLGSAFAAGNFSEKLTKFFISLGVKIPESSLNAISIFLVTLILSYLTLVFGELVPKRIAMQKAEAIGLALSDLIYYIAKFFAPIVFLLTFSTNLILKLFGIDPNAAVEAVSEEEIRMMVDAGLEKGTIDADEKYIIHNVFEFDDKTAGDIMTHRADVCFLWAEDSDEVWLETILNNKYSIYPICDGNIDNITGALRSKDYFRLNDKSRESVLKNAVRPAVFVTDSLRTDILFKIMQKNKNHFAVVLDDYGGVFGIVTMNDLLEQLVGDLENDDSFPEEEPLIDKIDNSTWKINGSAHLEEVSERLGVELPIEDYETFGGMVFSLLGTVPDDGATPELEEFGLLIKINKIKDHRLEDSTVYLTNS